MPLEPSFPENVTSFRSMQGVRMSRRVAMERASAEPDEVYETKEQTPSPSHKAAEATSVAPVSRRDAEMRDFAERHVAEAVDRPFVTMMKRGLTLGADAVVLTLAAPFIAVWALQRHVRGRFKARSSSN